ncbi:MAG: AAA family ATPase, partial [Candidatus Gracilibacteria bacterium]
PSELEADIAKHRQKFLQIGDSKTLYSLEDLFDDNSRVSYLVDRFITKSGLFLLAAAPKSYKSLLSYHLAFSIVRGLPFLGRFDVTQGKVLYVQAEENKETIKTRLKNIGFTREDNDSIRILRNFDLSKIDYLQEVIHDFRPSLVIIDTLRAASRDSETSENHAEFARPLYQLQSLASLNDISILILHHKNKSEVGGLNSVSGTSALAGATDGIFLLDPVGDKLVLTSIPRNTPPLSIAISYRGTLDKGQYKFVFDYVGECEVKGKELAILEDQTFLEETMERDIKSTPISVEDIDQAYSQYPDYRFVLERLTAFGVIVCHKDYYYWHRSLPANSETVEVVCDEEVISESNSQAPQPPEIWEEIIPEDKMSHCISQIPPDVIQVENGDYVDFVRFDCPQKPSDKRQVFPEAEVNNLDYECTSPKAEVVFRAPKAYFERVAPQTLPMVSVHVKSAPYYRRIFNPKTIEDHVLRVLDRCEFLPLHDLLTEYDINQVKEYVETKLDPSRRAFFKWMLLRYKTCILKDMPNILKDPPFTAMHTMFGDSGILDYFHPVPLEREYEVKFRAFLESLALTDLPYEFHKVPPPKEAYSLIHPAKVTLRNLLPMYSLDTDVSKVFLEKVKEFWGQEVADSLKDYLEYKPDAYTHRIDTLISSDDESLEGDGGDDVKFSEDDFHVDNKSELVQRAIEMYLEMPEDFQELIPVDQFISEMLEEVEV